MKIAEKVAYLMFHHHGNMCELNTCLYQLGLRDGDTADEKGKYHFYKAIESYNMMSEKDKQGIWRP